MHIMQSWILYMWLSVHIMYWKISDVLHSFYCLYCLKIVYSGEIAELKAQISSLTSKVSQLSTPEQTLSSHATQ